MARPCDSSETTSERTCRFFSPSQMRRSRFFADLAGSFFLDNFTNSYWILCSRLHRCSETAWTDRGVQSVAQVMAMSRKDMGFKQPQLWHPTLTCSGAGAAPTMFDLVVPRKSGFPFCLAILLGSPLWQWEFGGVGLQGQPLASPHLDSGYHVVSLVLESPPE